MLFTLADSDPIVTQDVIDELNADATPDTPAITVDELLALQDQQVLMGTEDGWANSQYASMMPQAQELYNYDISHGMGVGAACQDALSYEQILQHSFTYYLG